MKNSGVHPKKKKTKQGDAVCVLWVATPRVHHRKKNLGGLADFRRAPHADRIRLLIDASFWTKNVLGGPAGRLP